MYAFEVEGRGGGILQDLDELRSAVADRAAVVVVGTGVTKALTNNARAADWFGLVENGIAHARRLGSTKAWEQNQQSTLDYARAENDPSALISVASRVQSALRRVGPQAYFDWLRESVGSLKVTDGAVARAIGALGVPILTTNYDQLLESVLKRPAVVWEDQNKMRDLLKGEQGIGHLHGVWDLPSSVVLSDTDYQRILDSDPAQHLQSAHYSMKAFVFIGYGAGLADPNFGNMLAIHRKLFPESNHAHFRLCKASEFNDLFEEHGQDAIRPVVYGERYEDLLPFLRSLAPAGSPSTGQVDTVAFAAEAILDQLRSETVLADDTILVDDRQLHEITVPPLLLPLPHDQFSSYRKRDEADERPEPRDPAEVYGAKKFVVVVGEEGAGVSTTLKWLISHAVRVHHRAAPLYIDARACRSAGAALRKEVTRESIARRLIDHRRDPIPTHVLAVDNVKPVITRAYQSLVEDLRSSTATSIFLGVRLGDEAEVVDALAGTDRATEVVYLGKPGRPEVKALVKMIAPAMSESLAEQVIEVVKRERLQRTPFNISLLIVLLARGAGSNLNSSDTAVLDKYVQLLLGRSGSFLDPRWTLDPQNREAVLAHLAKHMVEVDTGGLPQSAAIAQLEAYFESVDWQEDAAATLETFRSMRVLRVHDGTVQFQQTAYLHLFAAKAAIDDAHFLDQLLGNQLYYGTIIRHYAALVRNSDLVVSQLLKSLDESWPTSPPVSKIFEELDALPAPETADSVLTPEADVANDPEDVGAPQEPTASVEPEADWGDDDDRIPFPLDDPATWSLTQQLVAVLDLSSRVVRDSDQVEELELKDRLFAAVLERWGYLTDVMAGDQAFAEIIESVVLGLPADTEEDQQQRRALMEDMQLTMPMFIALGGISATLASRKLLRTYERSAAAGAPSSVYTDLAGVLFAFLVGEEGWAARLPDVAARYPRAWFMPQFLYALVRMTYDRQQLSPADEESIERFFDEFHAGFHVFRDERHRRVWVKEKLTSLRRDRRMSRRRLAEGERAIDGLIDSFESESPDAPRDVN